MTVTHKQIGQNIRDNMSTAQSSLWTELRGLRTGARFTRAKFRYGVLCDFYCDSVRLAVIVLHRGRSLVDLEALENHGIHVICVQPDAAILEPNRTFADVSKAVTFRTFVKSKPLVEALDGVIALRYDAGVMHCDIPVLDDKVVGRIESIVKSFGPNTNVQYHVVKPEVSAESRSV